MITTNIIYDRKKQAKKNGIGTLEVRITVERRSYYISSGIRVRESEWKAGQIVNRRDARTLNERLAVIYEKVSNETNACISDGRPINTEDIRRKVFQISEAMSDEPVLLDWIEEQIPLLNLTEGTAKHYRTLYARLIEFGEIRRWQDLTVENIFKFDAWLHRRKTSNGTFITDAGVYKYHKCFKALLNRADRYGKIERNPYERTKGQLKRGDRENIDYLTENEMQAFENLIPPADNQLITAHDLFVFQMYTGLSYSDMMAFDINDYKWDGTHWRKNGERIKTGVPFVSSLLPPAVHVLEKYDMKIPRIDNADYNHALKVLGHMAGIKTRLHSHLARHTFATYMLRNGAKIENVSRMLGHTNIRQTQRYAKVLAQSVHDDFDMIAKKLNPNKKVKGR